MTLVNRPAAVPGWARALLPRAEAPGVTVALGAALVLTGAVLDLTGSPRLGALFDVTFILNCLVLGAVIRSGDFIIAALAPAPLMLCCIAVVAASTPHSLTTVKESWLQAVIDGMGGHAGALLAGFLATAGVLAWRALGESANLP